MSSYSMDNGEERLLSIAEEKIKERDYVGALKMINRSIRFSGESVAADNLCANVYAVMNLPANSENCSFRAVDLVKSRGYDTSALIRPYVNILASLIREGSEMPPSVYFKWLSDIAGEDNMESVYDQLAGALVNHGMDVDGIADIYGDQQNRTKPCKAYRDGRLAMSEDDYGKAVKCFREVKKDDMCYLDARNDMAMCYMMMDKPNASMKILNGILRENPDNVRAQVTYAAVCHDLGDDDAAVSVLKDLSEKDIDDVDDICRLATVCCEAGMYEESLEVIGKADEMDRYGFVHMFIKACALYNCGKFDAACTCMSTLTAVYPDAFTARYFLTKFRETKDGGKFEAMSYDYRVPDDISMEYVMTLIPYADGTRKEREKMDTGKLRDAVEWALDLHFQPDVLPPLLSAAVVCATDAGYDDIIRSVLLDAYANEFCKFELIREIAKMDRDQEYGIVFMKIYITFRFYHLKMGRTKRRLFIDAYADVLSKVGLMSGDAGDRVKDTCELLYKKAKDRDLLASINDYGTVAAALYKLCGVRISSIDDRDICESFGADSDIYARLIL